MQCSVLHAARARCAALRRPDRTWCVEWKPSAKCTYGLTGSYRAPTGSYRLLQIPTDDATTLQSLPNQHDLMTMPTTSEVHRFSHIQSTEALVRVSARRLQASSLLDDPPPRKESRRPPGPIIWANSRWPFWGVTEVDAIASSKAVREAIHSAWLCVAQLLAWKRGTAHSPGPLLDLDSLDAYVSCTAMYIK